MVELPGATVLDAFAGSGALGIEALSRGAEHATFVERDRAAQKSLPIILNSLASVTKRSLFVPVLQHGSRPRRSNSLILFLPTHHITTCSFPQS